MPRHLVNMPGTGPTSVFRHYRTDMLGHRCPILMRSVMAMTHIQWRTVITWMRVHGCSL